MKPEVRSDCRVRAAGSEAPPAWSAAGETPSDPGQGAPRPNSTGPSTMIQRALKVLEHSTNVIKAHIHHWLMNYITQGPLHQVSLLSGIGLTLFIHIWGYCDLATPIL